MTQKSTIQDLTDWVISERRVLWWAAVSVSVWNNECESVMLFLSKWKHTLPPVFQVVQPSMSVSKNSIQSVCQWEMEIRLPTYLFKNNYFPILKLYSHFVILFQRQISIIPKLYRWVLRKSSSWHDCILVSLWAFPQSGVFVFCISHCQRMLYVCRDYQNLKNYSFYIETFSVAISVGSSSGIYFTRLSDFEM